MGDFVIRDMPDDLKQEIAHLAHHSGRSLSDEAKYLLKVATTAPQQDAPSADIYADFRHEYGEALLTDDEHTDMMSAIDTWRHESTLQKAEAAE